MWFFQKNIPPTNSSRSELSILRYNIQYTVEPLSKDTPEMRTSLSNKDAFSFPRNSPYNTSKLTNKCIFLCPIGVRIRGVSVCMYPRGSRSFLANLHLAWEVDSPAIMISWSTRLYCKLCPITVYTDTPYGGEFKCIINGPYAADKE